MRPVCEEFATGGFAPLPIVCSAQGPSTDRSLVLCRATDLNFATTQRKRSGNPKVLFEHG